MMRKFTLLPCLFLALMAQAQQFAASNTKLDIGYFETSRLLHATTNASYTLVLNDNGSSKGKKKEFYFYKAEVLMVPADHSKPRKLKMEDYLSDKKYYGLAMQGDLVQLVGVNKDFYDKSTIEFYAVGINGITGEIVHPMQKIASYPIADKEHVKGFVDTLKSGRGIVVYTDMFVGKDAHTVVAIASGDYMHASMGDITDMPSQPRSNRRFFITAQNKIVGLWQRGFSGQSSFDEQHVPYRVLHAMVYDVSGKKLNDNSIEEGTNFFLADGVQEAPDGKLLITGLYTESVTVPKISGCFVQKFNADGSKDGATTWERLDPEEMVSKMPASLRPVRKTDEDIAKSSLNEVSSIHFVNLLYNPSDRSQILICEENYPEKYTGTGEIILRQDGAVIMKIDANGHVIWIDKLVKQQRYTSSMRMGSMASMVWNGKLLLLMHDYAENTTNPAFLTAASKPLQNYKKARLYAITIDLNTGESSRTPVMDNDDFVACPPTACITDEGIYMVSKDDSMRPKTGVIRVALK